MDIKLYSKTANGGASFYHSLVLQGANTSACSDILALAQALEKAEVNSTAIRNHVTHLNSETPGSGVNAKQHFSVQFDMPGFCWVTTGGVYFFCVSPMELRKTSRRRPSGQKGKRHRSGRTNAHVCSTTPVRHLECALGRRLLLLPM